MNVHVSLSVSVNVHVRTKDRGGRVLHVHRQMIVHTCTNNFGQQQITTQTSHLQTRVSPGLKNLLQQGYNEVKQCRTTEHVKEKFLIEFKQLPEDDVDLLCEVDLLNRVRKIGVP